jgi:hypothetical protein
MSNKFSIEIIEAPKQNSIEWYIIQRDELEIKSRYLEIKPYQYGKQLIALENKAREMYRDEIEAAAIISSAEQSTKAASQKTEAFAIGYDQGYNRALDLVEWKIKNELKNTK